MMKKVLIPTKLDKFAAKLLTENGFDVVQDADTPIDALVSANPDAAVVIVRSEKITPEIIDALPQLKLIVRAGAGFNTIDIKYARKHNVDVMNTPGANSNAVAEEVVAMILGAYRHLVVGDVTTRAGQWEKKKLMGSELTGKTIGILGLGHIGQLLVKRLSGFEVKALGHDPFISADFAKQLGVELASVEDIFSKADIISLHIPENNETRGMIDAHLFALMKSGAMLVNCARSGVVNEADLRAAKQAKKIIYCTDVYPKDEPGEKSVVDVADLMLPHLGANTNEANFAAAKRAAEQTVDYFERGITTAVVNKALPDNFDPMYQELAFVVTKIAHKALGCEQPSRIATSFYGKLHEFAKWMTGPIAAAISPEVDQYDAADAADFFARRGVEVVNREVDDSKNYGNAMTIDLFAGKDAIHTVSVRGTTAENNLMISRIGEFEHIYLEPSGNILFVQYADAPGMIGKIAGILGEKNININDIRAPRNPRCDKALAIFKTNVDVPQILVDKIREAVNAELAFSFSYKK
ncbi:MAG: NAD(P)-dependent oxidoreductase [Victivallaceae bacterium]|nr:NAD(P)-dependent oxidoreductase [Victivallaceae bacterium]